MTINEQNKLSYDSSFGTIDVIPQFAIYGYYDTLYMGFLYYDDEDLHAWDDFGDITVNIEPLPYLESAIDTNNNGEKILGFLKDNGFGELTGKYLSSGFCRYPVFRFREEVLEQHAPDVLAQYRSLHGREKPSLNSKIASAEKSIADSDTHLSDKGVHDRKADLGLSVEK